MSDKYFKKTQDAYNSLENIFKVPWNVHISHNCYHRVIGAVHFHCLKLKNIFYSYQLITDELTVASHDRVEEVVILLGTSFLNPQEMFRICIPSLNYSHLEKHHSTRKNSRNLFK